MQTVLQTLRSQTNLKFQLMVTGMHLHAEHGRSIDAIRKQGWKIDAVIPWKLKANPLPAESTGTAIAKMAHEFDRLKTDIVLVVGDRVEAFAAATAGHLSNRLVAHIHGGDRAPGQVDDSLRHAITKLAHVHFPATLASAKRIRKLGEEQFRIHRAGSPGIENVSQAAALSNEIVKQFPKVSPHQFALIVLHPITNEKFVEYERAKSVLDAVWQAGVNQTIVVYPNNDPGANQVIQCWCDHQERITYLLKDAARPQFLGLLRDCAFLIGNSSAGIIEAASFGTPVLDVGSRQQGRERSQNVTSVSYEPRALARAIKRVWNNGKPRRWRGNNAYGGAGTANKIAGVLSRVPLDARMLRKLIAY